MDDSDQMVVKHAKHKLLEFGTEIIPNLERLEEDSFVNPRQLENVTEVLDALRLQHIKSSLKGWLQSEDKNLMHALFIICSYQYPELKIEDFTALFQKLRHQCWMEVNSRQTSFEKVEALNKVFFDVFNFVKVSEIPYSPFDIFINSVMDSRQGTDISLGLIYSIVAESLDIPVYGVTTLNNRAPYILAYMDKDNLLPILNWGIENNGVLFYIGIGSKGLIIDPKQLKEAYASEGLPQNKSQFEPSPNTLIIKKYLMDIKRSFENHVQFRYKLNDIDELLEFF
ncbi:transglutaminase family protein [Brumimicrobium aurantiacum]|uniref:Protein SirB1 N-terminal domain-containing protein n=1 Tax=Brumimicrobium aurantiacum TaxID=1737063 RepID=A0A3E1F0Q1_9FLAO|nr:transglutaminase family protein [Brumimicrobium aurantiacum]RFC55313.1 hypothetical protein DXU93_05690 [Brumimicrobium aurantiacum]